MKKSKNANPNFKPTLFALAKIRIINNDLQGAIDYLEMILRLNFNDIDSIYLIGLLYFKTGVNLNNMIFVEQGESG